VVLAAIRRHIEEHGTAVPTTNKKLAEGAGVPEEQVKQAVQDLVKTNVIGKKSAGPRGFHFTIFQASAAAAVPGPAPATEPGATAELVDPQDLVLEYLRRHLEQGPDIPISQGAIATALKLTPFKVYEVVDQLVNSNRLVKKHRSNRGMIYTIPIHPTPDEALPAQAPEPASVEPTHASETVSVAPPPAAEPAASEPAASTESAAMSAPPEIPDTTAPVQAAEDEEPLQYCPHCGRKLRAHWVFCGRCGTQIDA